MCNILVFQKIWVLFIFWTNQFHYMHSSFILPFFVYSSHSTQNSHILFFVALLLFVVSFLIAIYLITVRVHKNVSHEAEISSTLPIPPKLEGGRHGTFLLSLEPGCRQ